jgi:hypothetical protein
MLLPDGMKVTTRDGEVGSNPLLQTILLTVPLSLIFYIDGLPMARTDSQKCSSPPYDAQYKVFVCREASAGWCCCNTLASHHCGPNGLWGRSSARVLHVS